VTVCKANGRIEVTVCKANGRIEVTVCKANGRIEVTVQATCISILCRVVLFLVEPVEPNAGDKPEESAPVQDAPERTPKSRTALAGGFVALAVLGLYQGLSGQRAPTPDVRDSGGASAIVDSSSFESPDAEAPATPQTPSFRVASYKADAALELVDGAIGKRTFLAALTRAGVSLAESTRITRAFEGVRKFDRCHPKDTFLIARDRTSHHVVGFEYEVSAIEIYQAREVDSKLVAKRLDLNVSKRRVTAAILVGDDFKTSVTDAGLETDIMKRIDDALDGHLSVSDIRHGGRLKIVAIEARLDGAFLGYERIEAVEYAPPRLRKGAAPLRVYGFADGKHISHYDAKGQKPFHGGWRLPIPMARITSRFNPKRMHPVLHRIMPHNGIDFAGSTGTPVYAVASGVLKFAADSGPCGNMVQILHAGGLSSSYCHLSKFAPGLDVGEKIEARTLVGYVGQTGRVTGPHLHFAVKRAGQFVDPATLKMGEVAAIAKADREAFAVQRKALDLVLDGLVVAVPPSEADAGAGADAGEGDDDENLDLYEETQ
jgi:murein DD-endopeptidase MepM/ murein hydrolase activator NlpD